MKVGLGMFQVIITRLNSEKTQVFSFEPKFPILMENHKNYY